MSVENNGGGNGNGNRSERWFHYGLYKTSELLNISPTSLFQYLATGKLKWTYFCGEITVTKEEIERFERNRRIGLHKRGRPRKDGRPHRELMEIEDLS